MSFETKTRSIVKSLSYRICSSLLTSAVVYLIYGKWDLAAFAGLSDFVVKIILYFLHERIWQHINFGKWKPKPSVIWFTGLSGAGKTTLANKLAEKLRSRNFSVEELDGDSLREIFPLTGFSRLEREQHIRRVAHLAGCLERHGVHVIASLISPFQESRNFAKSMCRNFIEVYLSTPIEVCEKRDPKGLYLKARRGEIKAFTGIDDVYEPPQNPDLVIDTSQTHIDLAVKQILNAIEAKI